MSKMPKKSQIPKYPKMSKKRNIQIMILKRKEKVTTSTVISESNGTNSPKADKNVFQCDECNYKSSSESGIKIHKSKKHIYRCRYCNQISPDQTQHSNHVSECSASHIYNSPIMSPRGHFLPIFPCLQLSLVFIIMLQ